VQDAVHRRLMQELGITAELSFHYDFIYKAQYLEIGTEHELCSVWMGTSDDPIAANKDEIEAWRFVDPQHLQAELEQTPESFTPWMKLEWQRITKEHLSE